MIVLNKKKLNRAEISLFLIPLFLLVAVGGWWFDDIQWAINPNAEPFEKAVRYWAGFGALDCGHKQVGVDSDAEVTNDACSVASIASHRSFRIIYSTTQPNGEIVNIALAGRANGKLYIIRQEYSSTSLKVINGFECVAAHIALKNKRKTIVWSDIVAQNAE